MITSETFKNEVEKLTVHLYESQKENLEKMAETMASCIADDGVIQVFGSGHSVGLGLDIKDRPGALVPIHILDMNDFTLKGNVPLSVLRDKVNVFERKPGVAKDLYALYDIRPQDVFIVISNSGINGVGIDIAQLARDNGHQVIVITSMAHTLAEKSRHPSGKKLYQFGTVVVDNCGPHGDALLPTETEAKICSVSSICNNLIAQSTAARTCELLAEKGVELPVLTTDPEHNKKLYEKYEGRI